MSNLALNQNQLFQTPMLGMVTLDQQPNTVSAQINPSTAATVIAAGCSVKLVSVAGPQVIVDLCTSASDGPVFGVINYNMRKNTYVGGDMVEVSGRGNVVMLKTSAAVNRGNAVATTNPTVSTNDATVASDAVTGDYITGLALGTASGANILIKVQISPALNASGYISVSP